MADLCQRLSSASRLFVRARWDRCMRGPVEASQAGLIVPILVGRPGRFLCTRRTSAGPAVRQSLSPSPPATAAGRTS